MSSIAQQVAVAIRDFQQHRTGHAPGSVNVVLSNDTVVITLQNALTSAERLLSRTPEGSAQVQEYHRRLFESSVETLKQEIERITGVAVREAAQLMTRTAERRQDLPAGVIQDVHLFVAAVHDVHESLLRIA